MTKLDNLIGKKFGKLTVYARAPNNKGNKAMWYCVCDCGNKKTKPVDGYGLKSGNVRSCGCEYFISNKGRKITHNQSKTRLYNIWASMKRRCKVDKNYKNISVCDEWQKYENFMEWAINNGYNEKLTIDRIDNTKGYCPENCRWATYKQQENNRTNNTRITYNNETHTISEWSGITGISAELISYRLHHGWSIEDMFIKPDFKNQPSRRALWR